MTTTTTISRLTYADRVKLLYTDTDSVIVHVQTDDMYKDMLESAAIYDTSNYVSLTTHSTPPTTRKSSESSRMSWVGSHD